MISEALISVRSAEDKDRTQLANMLHFETHVHRHLDWRPPLDWLGYEPYVVAEKNGKLIAALACPPDPPGVAWVRIFATTSNAATEEAWQLLWPMAEEKLTHQPALYAAAIPLQKWFRRLLEHNGFNHVHNVVTLLWDGGVEHSLIPPQYQGPIRHMTANDLEAIHDIDLAAFGPIWRNSLDSIKLAYQQSAIATVATDEEGILGYQISTPSSLGTHLARLAVHPRGQRRGVGYALVRHLQDHYAQQEQKLISVNTQDSNASSLALYAKAGFSRTDEAYPVYQLPLTQPQ